MTLESRKIAEKRVKEFLESNGSTEEILRKEARILIKISLNRRRPATKSDSLHQRLRSNSKLEWPSKSGNHIHSELLKDKRFRDCVNKELEEISENLGRNDHLKEIGDEGLGKTLKEVLGSNYLIYRKNDFNNTRLSNAKTSQIKSFEKSLKKVLEPISCYFDVEFESEQVENNEKLINVSITVDGISESYQISKFDRKHRDTIKAVNRILNHVESNQIYFVGAESRFEKEIFFLEKEKMRAFIDYFEQPEEAYAPEIDIKIRKS